MSEPTVGIVVRTKDRPDFLRRALKSITEQTHREWECVIVNDGGAVEPVEGLVRSLDPADQARFRVVHARESRGRWVSANAGVLATTAPLLVLHDDDDTWHPDFLRRAVGYMEAHPERGGVVSRIEIVWERRVPSGFEVVDREIFQPRLSAPTLADTLLYNRFVPIAFVYRRSLHEELGLYDESLPVVGDWAFNLRVLSREPLEYLGDDPLAYWHQRVDATGAHGNSVIDSREAHAATDAQLRDAALRDYVQAEGLGLALYLTKFIDQRFVDVENIVRYDIAERSIGPTIRRALARLVGRKPRTSSQS